MERIIYQNAPIPPICSHRLYRSALATTSLHLFLLCADFPFYRLLHIWGRVSKSLTRCVEECQRPVFHTQGSSCGSIYPFALCSIQWDFYKSLSLDLSKGSSWIVCVPVEPSWLRAELTQRYASLCLSLSLRKTESCPVTTFSHDVARQDRQSAHIYRLYHMFSTTLLEENEEREQRRNWPLTSRSVCGLT